MGQDLVFFFGVERPWALGAFPCLGVMVTAADRAAATCLRWVPSHYRKRAIADTPQRLPLQRELSAASRGLNQDDRRRTRLSCGTMIEVTSHPERLPLSGREREGEAFLRKAASLALIYHLLSPRISACRFFASFAKMSAWDFALSVDASSSGTSPSRRMEIQLALFM